MNYERSRHSFKSSNGVDNVAYYIYTPVKGKAKALVQISHGMCEHSGRYEQLIDYLCQKGYAVIIHDHIGHGNSVSDPSDLGYFGLKNGWIYLIKDLRQVQIIGRSMFGKIPHYFLGHSMGSLVVRCLLGRYSADTDGAVLIGTVQKYAAIDAAILLAEHEITMHGVKSRSHKMNSIFMNMCGSRIEEQKTQFDWLSRDDKAVAEYCDDKKCNFVFTCAGFRDLFMLLSYCTERSWYKKVRPDLPMLIMSGTEDPVGGYGKGIMKFYNELEKHGFSQAEIKLWDGCRHELCHELNKLDFYEELSGWLDRQLEER